MIKEIECVEENLEGFILHGEQVPVYVDFSGEPNPKKCNKKTIDYYHQGKRFAKQFSDGEDFLESLKVHAEKCEKCLKNMDELKTKYNMLRKEEIKKMNDTEIKNLKYFGLLN